MEEMFGTEPSKEYRPSSYDQTGARTSNGHTSPLSDSPPENPKQAESHMQEEAKIKNDLLGRLHVSDIPSQLRNGTSKISENRLNFMPSAMAPNPPMAATVGETTAPPGPSAASSGANNVGKHNSSFVGSDRDRENAKTNRFDKRVGAHGGTNAKGGMARGREGDLTRPVEDCRNVNLSWRTECNGVSRPQLPGQGRGNFRGRNDSGRPFREEEGFRNSGGPRGGGRGGDTTSRGRGGGGGSGRGDSKGPRGRGGKRDARGGRGGNRGGRMPQRNGSGRSSAFAESNENLWEDVLSDDTASICSERNEGRTLQNGNFSTEDLSTTAGLSQEHSKSSSTAEEGGAADEVPNEGASLLIQMLQAYERQNQEDSIARQNETPQAQLQRRLLELTQHREKLPIFQQKDDIIQAVKKNQVVIVHGETGSGKSTQLPQYLVEHGFAAQGKMIGITQPRRIAASSLAERVADELGVKLGDKVGYAVRFDKKVSKQTVIKYVTDGFLLKECTSEPNFDSYSVIIIDEAHERSLHTDVILGLAKRAINVRDDLKVIVSSATLDCQKLSEFFDNAPVLSILGRCYEVDIAYEEEPTEAVSNQNYNYLKRVVDIVWNIHKKEDPGVVLVFLPGKEEIDNVRAELECEPSFFIKSCHSNLPFDEQKKIHEKPPNGRRKIVLATNIAETSITIDGIVYVVDSGRFKQKIYDSRTKISSLVEQPITKDHAIQRQGRAGRTRPGKCFRVYTESEFNQLQKAPSPDIARSNLESVVLDLFLLGIADPLNGFDFIDKPPPLAIYEAVIHLKELSALTDQMRLTGEGRKMAEFPVDPTLAKVILQSLELRCTVEVSIIVAMLSAVQHRSIFFCSDPRRKRDVEKAKRMFDDKDGDHLTLLRIFKEWKRVPEQDRNVWCQAHFIESRYLVEAESIKNQLLETFKRRPFTGASFDLKERGDNAGKLSEDIRKAFTAGYFRQIAIKTRRKYTYESAIAKMYGHENKHVALHRTSALNYLESEPQLVIFHEVSKNKDHRAYMRDVIVIQPEWFKEYARTFYVKFLKRMNPAATE